MKLSNQQGIMSILLMTACLGCGANKNLTTKMPSISAYEKTFQYDVKVDGDKLIHDLLAQRFEFNKKIIKNGFEAGMVLPQPKSILNKTKLTTITFGKLIYTVKDSQILSVNGIPLTSSALDAINDKISKLDKAQQYCAEKANTEYKKPNRDLQYIKTLDRQYFSSLNAIRILTANISSLSKKPNPAVSIEMSLASMKLNNETAFIVKQMGKSVAVDNQEN